MTEIEQIVHDVCGKWGYPHQWEEWDEGSDARRILINMGGCYLALQQNKGENCVFGGHVSITPEMHALDNISLIFTVTTSAQLESVFDFCQRYSVDMSNLLKRIEGWRNENDL